MAGVTQTRDQEEPLVLDIIKHRAGNTAQTQCHEPAREGDGVPRTDPQEGGGRKRLKTHCGFRRRAARSVVSDSARPRGLQPARLLRPWGSPGKNTGVGCHSLLQGIFPTQKSNPGLLHCKQILYHLSHLEVCS